MRREDRHRLKLGASPRREPDEIITRFASCSRSKNGKHPVTVTLVGRCTENVDLVVLGVTCECADVPKQELEAIKRLGGETCVEVMEATLRRNCRDTDVDRSVGAKGIDLGYGFPSQRNRAQTRRSKSEPFKPEAEPQEKRWDRLFTLSAQKGAGAGFKALSVHWASATGVGWELTMFFGQTEVARRIDGTWKFDDVKMADQLSYSDGHRDCADDRGFNGSSFCNVCKKSFASFSAHTRKGRHIGKVIEGIKRAMYRLRKKKPEIETMRRPHPQGGYR